MSKETIERGDKVDIHFSAGESIFNAEVLYTPCVEGDSWRLLDRNGELLYIQKFEMMRLRTPQPQGGE